jgi:sulfite dehydrogenase
MRKIVRGGIASLLFLVACAAPSPAPAQSIERGKQLFTEQAEPPCALCHTLKAANSSGKVGPNLDELKLDVAKIRRAVNNGVGAMPPYGETLSEADIEAVVAYVADAIGSRK